MQYTDSTSDRDQRIHAITQVLEFFGKEADADTTRMWLWSLKDYPTEAAINALRQAIKTCEFAPRPAKIIKIIEEMREASGKSAVALPLHEPRFKEASPEVAKAWTWAIRQWGGAGETLFSDPKLTEQEVEEAVLLINQQCYASKNPQAYPAHCHLQSIWGCSYSDAVIRYGDRS